MIDTSPGAGDARWPLLANMLTVPPKGVRAKQRSGVNARAIRPAPEVATGRPADSDELPYGQPVERMRDIAAGHRAAQVGSSGV